MIFLTTAQYIYLSIGILILSIPLSYIGYKVVMNEYKRYKSDHYQQLDDIVKFKVLKKYLNYLMKDVSDFKGSFLFISIDGFQRLTEFIPDKVIKTYLKSFAKRTKYFLPKGAKMAQTNQREVFMIVIPEELDDEKLLAFSKKYKKHLERNIELNQTYRLNRTVTISGVTAKNINTIKDIYNKLRLALYDGIRKGGDQIVIYEPKLDATETFMNRFEILKSYIQNHLIRYEMMYYTDRLAKHIKGAIVLSKFNEPILNHERFDQSFMLDLEQSKDDYWMSQWMLETSLSYYQEQIRKVNKANVEVVIFVHYSQLSHELFVDQFINYIHRHGLKLERVILRVFHIDVKQDEMVKNQVDALKELGVRFALDYTKNLDHFKIFMQLLHPEFVLMDIEAYRQFESYHQILIDDCIESNILLTGVDTHDEHLQNDERIYGLFGKVAEEVMEQDEWFIYKQKNNHESKRGK